MSWDKIKEEVKAVIRYSQDFSTEPKVDNLIEQWAKAKESFFNMMGEQLIYEHPEEVTFEMNEQDKIHSVEDFIREVEWKYRYTKHIDALLEFLRSVKNNFFKNEVPEKFSCGNINIPKGMKINKALKFFFPDDKDNLTDIQNEVSRVIQKDKVKGILCISIHPLDFLSSSENTYKWRSCHALDGEYRAGNLSYMVDKSTVICYLRSTKDKQNLSNFPSNVPWNSKKWRMLLHFSEDMEMMFAGRQYPFSSAQGMKMVKDILLKEAGFPFNWTDWDNTKIRTFSYNDGTNVQLDTDYLEIDGKLKDIRDVVKIGSGALNFNDVLNSTLYDPSYSFRLHKRSSFWGEDYFYKQTSEYNTVFIIGGSVKCLCCEQEDIVIPETVRCISCEEIYGTEEMEDFIYCENCGRRMYYDNSIYVYDDGYYSGFRVCPDCAEEYDKCVVCGTYLTKDNSYVDEDGNVYCRDCYKEEK